MSVYTALQNTPIVVNLLTQSQTTGWTDDGIIAYHENSNSGNIVLNTYPITLGNTYNVTYTVLTITSGNVQLQSPGSNGTARTVTGFYSDTITPTSNGFISFYSNGNCSITNFVIQNITIINAVTINYATDKEKWTDFRTYYPDFALTIRNVVVAAYQGNLYSVTNNGLSRNNFFGVQYPSIIKFVEAKNPTIIKDFEALSYQANGLMYTTIDGIQTSLGQISTLIDTDFIKQNLASGGQTFIGYTNDGVYSASFMGDENSDGTVNGDKLQGNYIIIQLITNDASVPFSLYSINVRSRYVPIGSR